MVKVEIKNKLETIFNEIFQTPNFKISEELAISDIKNWDSFHQLLLISEIQQSFNIKFKIKEINSMRNIGDMIVLISQKLEVAL